MVCWCAVATRSRGSLAGYARTLTLRPAPWYSLSSGTMLSASRTVDTTRFTGEVFWSPTCSLVSSVVWLVYLVSRARLDLI